MILDDAKKLTEHLQEIRHSIHSHPEPSREEKETSAKVIAELQTIPGWTIRTNVGGYGVLADLNDGKPGKKIALRADMDALQIFEETDLSFKSQNEGVMHACGHDIHTTCLLGAARLLSDRRDELPGSVRLIFQPAEELAPVGGSRGMIDGGALDDVDAVFGLHVWPDLPHGTVGCVSGPLMAASDHFFVKIHGRSSHAAKPNEGIDAVVLGAQFVNAVQTIISRGRDPLKSAVLTIGKFNAGTRYNIVAEDCELEGTCRTMNPDVRDYIEKQMKQVLDGVCATFGATGELDYQRGYMPVLNDPDSVEKARQTVAKVFGDEAVYSDLSPSMCAEDFAFYLKDHPGAFLWLGTAKPEIPYYPLHNCRFQVDEDILHRGAALLAQIAIDNLEG